MQMHRDGLNLAPQPHAGGYPFPLTVASLSILRDKVIETPDATLAELISYLKIETQVLTYPLPLCCALQRLGPPRKKDARS